MRRVGIDRILTAAAVIASLGLTGLTVAALAYQWDAMRHRELARARAAAERAARAQTNLFEANVRTAIEAVGAARERSEPALDAWVTAQRDYHFVMVRDARGPLTVFPTTPSQKPLTIGPDLLTHPDPRLIRPEAPFSLTQVPLPAAMADLATAAGDETQLYEALHFLQTGVREQGLQMYREAGQSFRNAAALLAVQEGSLYGRFDAALAAFDSYIRANRAQALNTLLALFEQLEAAHPAAWGAPEFTALVERWGQLGQEVARRDLAQRLEQIHARSEQRDFLKRLRPVAQAALAQATAFEDQGLTFEFVHGAIGQPFVVAAGAGSGGAGVALVAPLEDVLERYWRTPEIAADWEVASPIGAASAPLYFQLPEAFGRRVLVPSPSWLAQLEQSRQRRLTAVIAISVAVILAWGGIMGLIHRGMRQQRNLLSLQRRFMADVSHELKTPLALIRVHSETLAAGRVKGIARRTEYEETIARESARLTRLLDNILDFSQMESGARRYQLAPCQIGEVLTHVWSLFAPRFVAEGFETQVQIDDDLPVMVADAQALEQVFVNLLQNAHRYSPPTRPRFVALIAYRQRDQVVVTVKDRGVGMTRRQIRRIGRSFERGEDPHVRRTRGTGLGLAIVQHIIKAHRGKLRVQSEVNEGTVMTVRLPIRR